jgi:predicted nucleic acid-binding protein
MPREADARRKSGVVQDFDDYFANTIAEIFPLTRDLIDLATEIRAQYNFKTPDALHLAAAVISNCDVFLTNDQRLNRFTGISIENI